jgi:hypothetical protein
MTATTQPIRLIAAPEDLKTRSMLMTTRFIAKPVLAGFALALLATAGIAATTTPAQARVFIGFGFGPYWGYPYPYAYPYPYYAPPVVYGAPGYGAPGYGYGPPGYGTPGYGTPSYGAPSAYAPAPAAATAAGTWYYCDNPAGYFPYIKQCGMPWRPVAAQEQQQQQ